MQVSDVVWIAAAAAVAGAIVLLVGAVRLAFARRALGRESIERPVDPITGLADHRAYAVRTRHELRIARRQGGNVWLAVVTIGEGDADSFGTLLADALRMPELGFRLAHDVFCVVRIDTSPALRADVIARIHGAAARARIAIGEASWPSGPDDPVRLLHAAIDSSVAAPAMAAGLVEERGQ